MPLPDDDRDALRVRLAPSTAAADVLAREVDDGEELREVLVDTQGDVVAFTARRALFVANGAATATAFAYGSIDLHQRTEGLGVDARIEGERLGLHVARSTFARLGVLTSGSAPGRASWLPLRAPAPRPSAALPPVPPLPGPPGAVGAPGSPVVPGAPVAPVAGGALGGSLAPVPQQPGGPPPPAGASPPASAAVPPGWHPDPSRRHWWRWWDGRDWTDFVADGGPAYSDPLPPRAP